MGKGGQDEAGSGGPRPDAPPSFPAWARTPTECLAELGVSVDHGLSSDEAAARLLRHGPNELERHALPPSGNSSSSRRGGARDGLRGAARHLPHPHRNAVVGVWQESNAEKALKEIQSEHATVKRDGRWSHALPARNLVVGDVVELRRPLAGGGAVVDWRARFLPLVQAIPS
ncbi:calcium-transporting ATPase 4, endoplasmic reticulum-type-like [Lolium perenne]|uniref:calcium-transporting ATPase 4, endoplasmic reticulum-type-like n=1 Tax=Lolium perenne TaxID=4522 RepID=UPI003A99EE62